MRRGLLAGGGEVKLLVRARHDLVGPCPGSPTPSPTFPLQDRVPESETTGAVRFEKFLGERRIRRKPGNERQAIAAKTLGIPQLSAARRLTQTGHIILPRRITSSLARVPLQPGTGGPLPPVLPGTNFWERP